MYNNAYTRRVATGRKSLFWTGIAFQHIYTHTCACSYSILKCVCMRILYMYVQYTSTHTYETTGISFTRFSRVTRLKRVGGRVMRTYIIVACTCAVRVQIYNTKPIIIGIFPDSSKYLYTIAYIHLQV